MRGITVALVGLVLVLAGCGSDDDSETTGSGAESGPSSTDPADLEGTWETAEPVTLEEMANTLREAGFEESVDGFEQDAPISDAPTTLVLEIADGTWNLSGREEGGPPIEIDFDARYKVEGDRIVVSHEGDSNTYQWEVNGDVLSLGWLETTYPDFKGIPEEVFQRALYTTDDFHRAP